MELISFIIYRITEQSLNYLNLFQYYYINTSEIPGELSRVNMISSHVTITCYFTHENIVIFASEKITIAMVT